AADFVEQAGTQDKLRGLTASARPYVPPVAAESESTMESLVALFRRFVSLTEHQRVAVALWCLHTHAFDAADATPYLHIHSAEKRSGKTRLLELSELIVANPWMTGSVTTAVLMRKIERDAPTLLLDETDATFKGDKERAEALRGILNSGYRRGGVASLCVK